MEQFINELRQSKFLNNIIDNHEVIAIYVGGSRLINVVDERSDYDIIVLTNDIDKKDSSGNYFLRYKDKGCHWYYRDLKTFFNGSCLSPVMTAFNLVIFNEIDDTKIIYKNSKYANLIDYLIFNKNKVALLGSYLLCEKLNKLINTILMNKQVLEENYTKYLYYLCYTSYFVNNEIPNTEFLKEIKRIRWQPVKLEYKDLIVERLIILNDYIEKHPVELNKKIEEMNSEINKLLSL